MTPDGPLTPEQRLALETLRRDGEWRPATLTVYLPATSTEEARLIFPDGRVVAA